MSLLLIVILVAAQVAGPGFEIASGEAVRVEKDRLDVAAENGQHFTFGTDSKSEVWKGKTSRDFSAIEPGDHVDVKYRRDLAGRFIVIQLWANIEHQWGVITRLDKGGFEMLTNPDRDPKSAYKTEKRQVEWNEDTEWQGTPDDLKTGAYLDVIGLTLRDRRLLATRIIIHEARPPARKAP